MKKILISGFETFHNHTENSSEVIVNLLKTASIPDHIIHTVILPVTFEGAFDGLKKEIDSFNPDFIICLGLAAKREKIELEKVAINFIHHTIPDNHGVFKIDEHISVNGPDAYFSTLPLVRMRQVRTSFPVEMSLSAGAYVCNYLMYRVLQEIHGTKTQAGFIHLPHLGKNQNEIYSTLVQLLSVLS